MFPKENKDTGSYKIVFNRLKWIKPIDHTTFKLIITTPLNEGLKHFQKGNDIDSIIKEFEQPTSVGAVETNYISLTSTPNRILILMQPPVKVYVGEVFQSVVSCNILSGAPTPDQEIYSDILLSTKDLDKVNNETIAILMQNLGEGKTDLRDLVKINKEKNI